MDLETAIRHAIISCERSGSRLTEKRRRVFACLLTATKPLSAYEIANSLSAEYGKTIPAMSVYRMLDFLEHENLVHKLKSTNKFVACAHIPCNHPHEVTQFLICDKCGQVKEVGIKREIIGELNNSVEAAGYQLQSSQLELHCLCQACVGLDLDGSNTYFN